MVWPSRSPGARFHKSSKSAQPAVVPFGVSTALEGHVIPTYRGVSIDTSRMNRVLEVHEQELDAIVKPGSFEFKVAAA